MERSNAAVGDAVASPTPTLDSTAREDSSPAILLANACSESCKGSVDELGQAAAYPNIDLVPSQTSAQTPHNVKLETTHSR